MGKDLEGLEADKPVDPANQKIVVKEDDPYKTAKTPGGWSLEEVLSKAKSNPRIDKQINKLVTQWTLRTDEHGLNATCVNTANEIRLKVSKEEDLTDAVLGISWEVINAINHTKLKELDQKAAEGTITKEQYINGILKVEADASINQEIIMYSMGKLTAPKGMTQKQIVNYFQDNYKKIVDEKVKEMKKSGKNGIGQTPDEAYGEQYDKLRKESGSEKESGPASGG